MLISPVRHRPDAGDGFQVMFLFSIGVTKGKWGTLLTNLLAFKRDYDSNRPMVESLAGDCCPYPAATARSVCTIGRRTCSSICVNESTWRYVERRVRESAEGAEMTPREAYEKLVSGEVETRARSTKFASRIAANAVMPYPPGIPMLMSGESFGRRGFAADRILEGDEETRALISRFCGCDRRGGNDRWHLSRSVCEEVAA